jgi:hypothetical protein
MLVKTYRKIVPLSFRQKIYDAFLGRIVEFFRNLHILAPGKFFFLFGPLLPKNEKRLTYAFIGKNGLSSYPFPASLSYAKLSVEVESDPETKLPYVLHQGRKLFFPRHFNEDKVQREYIRLLIEQDPQSPHRYIPSYHELENRTLLDVGAAEGIFALDTIELVKRVYLFEYEDFWQEALEETFKPWKDKVSIVRKFVSDLTEGLQVSIDDFLAEKHVERLFVKMDIEGAERKALEGARETLQSAGDIYLSVCGYHRKGDPEYLSGLMKGYGFSIEFAPGYLFWNHRLSKAVILCYKN